MAAKRLGSFLSNVTGTAGQVLRVNSEETGFEMFTPTTIPSYSVTNKTVDRVINADDVTLDEVADVLSTLIDDLSAIGSTGATQQVFTSQEYTHTNSDSGTTYTLTHNFGKVPDKIVCYYKNTANKWVESDQLNISGANLYGIQLYDPTNGDTENSAKVKAYRINEQSTVQIYFKCFILGQVAQINPFQWSTSEQVWPFEKDDQGRTLYCKKMNVGALPNTGTKNTAHNISSLTDIRKLFKFWSYAQTNASNTIQILLPDPYPGYETSVEVNQTNVIFICQNNNSGYDGIIYLIYAK